MPYTPTWSVYRICRWFLLSCLTGDCLRRVLAGPCRHRDSPGPLPRHPPPPRLLQARAPPDSHSLFDGMSHRNLVSWGSAISMYAQHGRDEEATALFAAFRRASSCEPANKFLLASALRACVQFDGCFVRRTGA
ncbi:hypothetical protein QYE76_014725 [Lolium multiflorum]|uniref:Pentatricopeptide repeat-containing protein n=1 Tax=Lolium multiflorum TaxID=4521 RepID=A0AAD8X5R4_LOLMU|nr:hypothetical protein QYE76_014725 [Lolium multiflorum]